MPRCSHVARSATVDHGADGRVPFKRFNQSLAPEQVVVERFHGLPQVAHALRQCKACGNSLPGTPPSPRLPDSGCEDALSLRARAALFRILLSRELDEGVHWLRHGLALTLMMSFIFCFLARLRSLRCCRGYVKYSLLPGVGNFTKALREHVTGQRSHSKRATWRSRHAAILPS